LRNIADENGGVADLRPGGADEDSESRRLMLGRAKKLERLGLAEPIGPASWTLKAAWSSRCVTSRSVATSSRRCTGR